MFLEPSAESVTAPAKIEFDLVNHGRESLSGNPYYWRLYKLVDDRWFPVDPWEFPLPLGSVQPGDVDETELFLYDGDPVDRQGSRTVGHLGGGQYAYAVGYSVGRRRTRRASTSRHRNSSSNPKTTSRSTTRAIESSSDCRTTGRPAAGDGHRLPPRVRTRPSRFGRDCRRRTTRRRTASTTPLPCASKFASVVRGRRRTGRRRDRSRNRASPVRLRGRRAPDVRLRRRRLRSVRLTRGERPVTDGRLLRILAKYRFDYLEFGLSERTVGVVRIVVQFADRRADSRTHL